MEVNLVPNVDVTAMVATPGGAAPTATGLPAAEGVEFGALLKLALADVELPAVGNEPPKGQLVSAEAPRQGGALNEVATKLLMGEPGADASLVLPNTELLAQNAQNSSIIPVRGEKPVTAEKQLLMNEDGAKENGEQQDPELLTAMVAAAFVQAPVPAQPAEPVTPTAGVASVVAVAVAASQPLSRAAEAPPAKVTLPEPAVQNAQQQPVQAMNQPSPRAAQPAIQPLTAGQGNGVKVKQEPIATAATPKQQPEPMVRVARAVDLPLHRGEVLPAAQVETAAAKETTKPAGILPRDLAMEVSMADPAAQGDVAGDTGQSMTGSGHEQAATAAHGLGQQALHGSKPVEQAGVVTPPTVQTVNHESVIEQVRDRLTSHEVRTDGNQVRLQLNPVDLGELQITLRMDDQKLRVEILAENKAVKTALLEHADTLKEVLARQNITVERLDVGTGGQEGLGKFFREGGRPEDQPRPFARLGQVGGFRQEVPRGQAMAAWQPRSNALVDVRF